MNSPSLLTKAGVKLVEPGKVELVAAARPRLIVGAPRTGNDEIIPQLGEIAPVVVLPVLQDELGTLGAITGHQREAGAVQHRLDTALAKLKQRIAASTSAGTAVSVLSSYGTDKFSVYGDACGFGSVSLGAPSPLKSPFFRSEGE